MQIRQSFSKSIFFTLFLCFALSSQAASGDILELKDAELHVYVVTDIDGKECKTKYEIRQGRRKIALNFRKAPQDGLFSGQRVKLKGKKLNASAIRVGTEEGSFEVISGSLPAALSGVRNSLVLRIQSTSAVTSASASQIASVMQTVDSHFLEYSHQMLSVKNDLGSDGNADVYTVTLNQSSAGASEGTAFSLCSTAQQNAVAQHGISTSGYNHIICILPPDMNYSWFGQAYINGREMVINGNYAGGYSDGYVHEIGHNLGMHHSNSGTTAPGTEYGETACIMGGNAGTPPRHFNGPHQLQMGWQSATTASAGTYELDAVELAASQRVNPDTLLKIRDTVANQDLYVSYRAPIGSLSSGLNIPYRTSIHSYAGGANRTLLLTSLGDGNSFVQNGITITQIAHTNTSATVSIGTACSALAPTLSISPSSQMSNTEAAKTYTLTLTNKDVNCANASFNLSSVLPTGWSASFGSNTLTIAAGQSASTSVVVTPAPGIIAGSYSFSLTANASGHPSASVNGQYVLDNVAPNQVLNVKAVQGRKSQVTVSWSAVTDNGAAGIANYDVLRNGVVIATTTNLSLNENLSAGTYVYSVLARDKAGNVGLAGVAPALTIASSGGGGGGGKGKPQ